MEIKKGSTRGKSEIDWLLSYHSFSFADYYSPENHHFSNLRVINEDFIAPSGGFPTHPHKDMEIVTFLVSGQLQHKDTLGNSTVIKPGEIQKMTAGTGIMHSEFNPSSTNPTHLLQIWILPSNKGLVPGYEQKSYRETALIGSTYFLAGPSESKHQGQQPLIHLNAQAKIFLIETKKPENLQWIVNEKEACWVQVISGSFKTTVGTLNKGDALKVNQEKSFSIDNTEPGQALIFVLPAIL